MNSMQKISINEILKNINEGTFIIFVFSSWCGQSKMNKPLFDNLIEKYPNINFIEIDADKENVFAKSGKESVLNIIKVPTFIKFNNGVELKRDIGFKNEKELREFIENE